MKSLTNPETSILLSEWSPPTRPYSQKELRATQDDILRSFRLCDTEVHHSECRHTYFIKHNGVKHKALLESEGRDIGNCSVCWKLRQTPRDLKYKAMDFVDLYREHFIESPESDLDYFKIEVFRIYYTWLYSENFR